MKIEVYLDDQAEPHTVFEPPESFRLDTTALEDGTHTLRLNAIDFDGKSSVREIKFTVHNGPGIAVHGLRDDDKVSGEISVLANAYSSKVGDIFEPMRIETPNPIPTWAWLLVLVVFAWSMWYLGMEYRGDQVVLPTSLPTSSTAGTAGPMISDVDQSETGWWQGLGRQVYDNNCASCHQSDGAGLPGLFPPLESNPAVLDNDPSNQVSAIVNGLQGKVIDGVSYPSPMPPFGKVLSDEEIAAVINHERSSWGNSATLVTREQVAELRN